MNAVCVVSHYLYAGACLSFPIFTLRCRDRGKIIFHHAYLSPASDYYGNVAGLSECGYRTMPRVEQTLAGYLSPGAASSLKAPVLPTKPLRVSSALVGKGYAAAGQSGACLHTMAVLQAYQADLLKELDEGEQISSSDVGELRRTADLALRATKETARAIGWSMAALVVAERHLWLTPVRHEREVSPSPLYSSRGCLEGAAPTSVPAPHIGRSKGRALPLVLPRSGTEVDNALENRDILRRSPVLQGSPEQLRRLFPAGPPCQGIDLAAPNTPEASLERLAPLVDYLAAWKLLPNVSRWVLQTVEKGYRIQFGAPPPPCKGLFLTCVNPEQALVLEQEVSSLLRKEAIEVVPPLDRESGFYSRYFVVPKKDGGLRPILDLRLLNRSVRRLKFRMLTVKQVVSQIRSEDWFVTIDLKDAYFHVSILPSHRKFLRFAFRSKAYQYRVLPFGLTLSPRTFTKCVDAAMAPWWWWSPEVVKQIWRVFGQAQVDPFATLQTSHCPLWYSLTHPAPLGLDAMVQTLPRLRLYAFPPNVLLPGVL